MCKPDDRGARAVCLLPCRSVLQVLIMNGDQEVLVPPKNAARIAARIPTARTHIFPGWGHGFKDVHAFVEVINAFMLERDDGERGVAPAAAAEVQ